MSYLYVFLGGGLGSVCRYLLARWIPSETFPWATLAANILSCIILGALVALASRSFLSAPYRLLLVTGFCGGFSTFSTFSNECLQFLKMGQYWAVALYVGLSLAAGLLSLLLGMRLLS